MNTRFAFFGVVVLLVFVGVSGCTTLEDSKEQELTYEPGHSPEELIIGTWSSVNELYHVNFTFYENNSVYTDLGTYTYWSQYDITDEQLIFINSVDSTTESSDYIFAENNQKMILTNQNGDIWILTRH